MKLTLIKPNIGRREHSLYVDEGRMEPLPLGILAALTPSDIDVVLYDDRMEPIPYDEPTDIVAITVETFTARRAYEISEEYQKRGVSVIMGGMHAKLIPNEVAEHCDCVIIGDAEPVWARASSHAAISLRARAICRSRSCSSRAAAPINAASARRRSISAQGISAVPLRRLCARSNHRSASSCFLSMTTSYVTMPRQRSCSAR